MDNTALFPANVIQITLKFVTPGLGSVYANLVSPATTASVRVQCTPTVRIAAMSALAKMMHIANLKTEPAPAVRDGWGRSAQSPVRRGSMVKIAATSVAV